MRLRWLRAASVLGTGAALLLGAITPVAAQTASSTPGWTPGPGATSTDTFTGSIDGPSQDATIPSSGNFNVDGWFVDMTAQGWAGADNVQVYLGQMGSGGTELAQGVVGEDRPDVGSALGNPYWSNSGFAVQVPASSVPSGDQTLNVYVHTPGKGWWFEPVTVAGAGAAASSSGSSSTPAASTASGTVATGAPQVSVTSPTEDQNVSTRDGDFTITGTVTSPGTTPSDIDSVEVWIGGERNSSTGTLLGDVTPNSDGSWFLMFTPTHFPSMHANLYVYAHSKSTGQETESVRGFNITDNND